MKNIFFLMNKNKKILSFKSNPIRFGGFSFDVVESYDEPLPLSFSKQNSGLEEWIRKRKSPSNRRHIEALLNKLGATTTEGFIRVSHALGLNDTFWIKSEDENLSWEDVSLYRNKFNDVIAQIAFDGFMSDRVFSSPSPELSTDGTYAKCWDRLEDGNIYLIKRGNENFGEAGCEPYSEYYASQIAEIICPKAVKYDLLERENSRTGKSEVVSNCKLFTSEKTGYLPFVRITDRIYQDAEIERTYEAYGYGDEFHRMLVLDAIILNTDRHQGNHGFLIDNDTQKIVGAAPVFDHNQSLLSDLNNTRFMSEYEEKLTCKFPRIGVDFISSAKQVLTDDIISDLKNLRGFKFTKHPKYNLPNERLEVLEKIINKQIDLLIS